MAFGSEVHIEDVEPDMPKLDVLYLDHDPAKAAEWMADQHVLRYLRYAGILLANAWFPDPRFEITYRDGYLPAAGSVGLLCGVLEVPALGRQPKTRADVWVQRSDGNYRWLWRHAMALVAEVERRTTPRQWVAMSKEMLPHVIAALEKCPDGVPPGPQTEPPVVREHARQYVLEEGVECVDAVLSFRAFYAARGHTLTWTARPLPPWLA